jgi:hypothetical protein
LLMPEAISRLSQAVPVSSQLYNMVSNAQPIHR